MKRFAEWIFAAVFLMGCTARLPQVSTSTPTSKPVSMNNTTPSQVAHPASTEKVSTTEPVSSTQDSLSASCASTEKPWYMKHLSGNHFTNGEWDAVVCSDNGVYTRVSNSSHNITWNVPSLDNDLSNPEPTWYWVPYLWSEDGKYLYLEPVCLCFIDSPWLIYSSGYGLASLNLEIGDFAILLLPSDSGYAFDFTQDGKLFAFSPANAYNTIQIRDLMSDTRQNKNFGDEYDILEFRWTPDASRLVIFTQESAEDESKSGFSVFVYSVEDDTFRKLMDKNRLNSSYPTAEFIEPRIYISDLSNEILFLSNILPGSGFQLNIRTGELVQVDMLTPTPVSQ